MQSSECMQPCELPVMTAHTVPVVMRVQSCESAKEKIYIIILVTPHGRMVQYNVECSHACSMKRPDGSSATRTAAD
jgi:hypothetical protein